MAIGTVRWFNVDKGYGFIQAQDSSGDVIVHITAVEAAGLRTPSEGQTMSYNVVMERGRRAASNLKLG